MKESISKKTIVIAAVIILVLLICIFALKLTTSNTKGFIVIDDFIIEYSQKDIASANLDDVKNHKFRMIYNDNYYGNYIFDHKDDFTNRLYFKNDDGVNTIKTPLLGLDDNVDLIDYKVEKMNNDDFKKYTDLLEKDINYKLADLTYGNKVVVDIGDSKVTIYTVKYEGNSEKDDSSMIFASYNNNIYVLDEDYSEDDGNGYTLYSFDVVYIVDLNKDNKYELIVAKNHYDVTDYSIYELNNNFSELYYTGK
jgi:hypothetical protein